MINFDASTLFVKPDELTTCKVEEIKHEIDGFFMDADKIIFDVSGVDKLDMEGLRMLISLKVGCEKSSKQFDVIGIDGGIHKFLLLLSTSNEWE
jgi:ABC-type transporter Mla MlaB component